MFVTVVMKYRRCVSQRGQDRHSDNGLHHLCVLPIGLEQVSLLVSSLHSSHFKAIAAFAVWGEVLSRSSVLSDLLRSDTR